MPITLTCLALEAMPLRRPTRSKLVFVASDIHFNLHDPPTWRALTKCAARVRPDEIVLAGDVLDFGMLHDKFKPGVRDPVNAIEQIACAVAEVNPLVDMTRSGVVKILAGNHEDRWGKYILGPTPYVLEGAKNLSLHDQLLAQGLDPRVQWVVEGRKAMGIKVGPFMIRHGHMQSGRFGGGEHLAANRLKKNNGQSELFGHHHRAQFMAYSAFGKTTTCIANPCMTGYHDYAGDANWQRGFTIIELHAPDFVNATAYPVIAHDGVFSWGGYTYDGHGLV